jgi:hypothetical protein
MAEDDETERSREARVQQRNRPEHRELRDGQGAERDPVAAAFLLDRAGVIAPCWSTVKERAMARGKPSSTVRVVENIVVTTARRMIGRDHCPSVDA